MRHHRLLFVAAAFLAGLSVASAEDYPLWAVYENVLKDAKYVDLTHAFAPVQPVWPGFGEATFSATVAGKDLPGYVKKGEVFTIAKQGFRATAYVLPSDQYGTQLDPPVHWNPVGATISGIAAVRPRIFRSRLRCDSSTRVWGMNRHSANASRSR